jgi:hypothetical protein
VQPIDHPEAVDAGVSVLRWPQEEPLRRQLAWFGLPRVLLVEPAVAPPDLLDELEDWMRTPADPIDLRARTEAVRRRSTDPVGAAPLLDDDGLLWVGATWVALTPSQVPVARLLLDHLDKVVRFDAVAAACRSAGASGHPASVRTLITRLTARMRTVGLELVSVRQRGLLLTTGTRSPSSPLG